MNYKNKRVLLILRDANQWGFKHLLQSLSKIHDVSLMHVNKLDLDTLKLLKENNIQYFQYQSFKLLNILEYILSITTKKPESKNYDIITKRNIVRHNSFKAKFDIYFYKFFPKILSVNFVFKLLGYFSSIYDNIIVSLNPDIIIYPSRFISKYSFLARAYKLKYKIYPFIFSWDNPFKDKFLPNLFDKYFVWNEEMAHDLFTIHKVDMNKSLSCGAFMFDYLKYDYINITLSEYQQEFVNFLKNHTKKYYLYTCGIGYSPSLYQEIELIKEIYNKIIKYEKDALLIVRPYPDQPKGVEPYKVLKNLGIIIQEDIIAFNIQIDATNYIKKILLSNAKCVINAFTTMVFEASYFDVPVIQMGFIPQNVIKTFKSKYSELNLDVIFHNEHIQKYLIKYEYENVVKNWDEFETILIKILNSKMLNFDYNCYLRNFVSKGETNMELLLDVL